MKYPILAATLLPLFASGADEDLAKQLANPVSSLISLPIQGNIDFGIGPGDGQRDDQHPAGDALLAQ